MNEIKMKLSNLAWGLVPAAWAISTSSEAIGPENVPYSDLGVLIRVVMMAVIIVAGLAALAFLLMGGLQYITSGGDKVAAASARDKITYAIIGLAIVVGAYAIARVMEAVFGVSIVSGIKWPESTNVVGQL